MQFNHLPHNRLSTCVGIFCLIFSCGCQNSGGADPEKKVVEIPIAGDFRHAELVRNPVTAGGAQDLTNTAKILFRETAFDFGEVKEGTLVTHTFEFTNTGKVPLVISRAYSTCGCTVPKWPESPVLPGEKGKISVQFNTEGKVDIQNKPVYITANTLPGTSKVYLQGRVIPGNARQ